MISLKRYLDSVPMVSHADRNKSGWDFTSMVLASYSSALETMGSCSVDACPGLGSGLKENLTELSHCLLNSPGPEVLTATGEEVRRKIESWGRETSRHYREKTDEVKDLLIVMARTAESVGERDQRCAGQIHEVTTRLTSIATLEDLTQIRISIEKSAADLKTSIDRMTTEGKAAIDQLQEQVSSYREKLEAAEEIASRDALTNLRNRLCIERLIERKIAAGAEFCVAIVDIDAFKKVNDEHGHLAGDALLKQFAIELTSASRSTDAIGRWGGDEFLILLECGLVEAGAQIDRLSKWVCGNYTVEGKSGPLKLRVRASIGHAGFLPGEEMKDLLTRADDAMYQNKASSRAL